MRKKKDCEIYSEILFIYYFRQYGLLTTNKMCFEKFASVKYSLSVYLWWIALMPRLAFHSSYSMASVLTNYSRDFEQNQRG